MTTLFRMLRQSGGLFWAGLRWAAQNTVPLLGVAALFLAAVLLFIAMSSSTDYNRFYTAITSLNVAGLVLVLGYLARQLLRLVKAWRLGLPGIRLHMRLLGMFLIIALIPVSLVYFFSIRMLNSGIDSWFDRDVTQALESAKALGQSAIDERKKRHIGTTQFVAYQLQSLSNDVIGVELDAVLARTDTQSYEMQIVDNQLGLVASSLSSTILQLSIPKTNTSSDIDRFSDSPLSEETSDLRNLVATARDYNFATQIVADPQLGQIIQVAVRVEPPLENPQRLLFLIADYPMPREIEEQMNAVRMITVGQQQITYLEDHLQLSYTISLSLMLFISLLLAGWGALFTAKRLTAPIRDLAEGTRKVADGQYDMELAQPSQDDLGFLVNSFNVMTRRLSLARSDLERSRKQTENQRAYLEAVLSHLSSGVLVLDTKHNIRRFNRAACQILGISLQGQDEPNLDMLMQHHPHLRQVVALLKPHLASWALEWDEELHIQTPQGRRILLMRGTWLPGRAETSGYVVVFEDITALVEAQRGAAWSEVAKRLAHEIKNPLTPIQLSAERLQHKLSAALDDSNAAFLRRMTHTIIDQVEAMKRMVKAFSDYARPPKLELAELALQTFLPQALQLYADDARVQIELEVPPELPTLHADRDRLRQVVLNLVKNALEASTEDAVKVQIQAQRADEIEPAQVRLRFCDNGPGIPDSVIDHLFEPYATTKPKGTGLGLAIVKRIVEEHGGSLAAENRKEGGACFTLLLPLRPSLTEITA
jgi:PAS domain S-box-containing protein